MLPYWNCMSVHRYHYSSSANKANAGFNTETTNFFSRRFTYWGDDDNKRYSDKKCFKLRNLNTNALLLSLNSLCYSTFFVEWDMWRMRFDRNLPENGNLIVLVWAYARKITKKIREFSVKKCRHIAATVLLQKYNRSHSFALVKFLARY